MVRLKGMFWAINRFGGYVLSFFDEGIQKTSSQLITYVRAKEENYKWPKKGHQQATKVTSLSNLANLCYPQGFCNSFHNIRWPFLTSSFSSHWHLRVMLICLARGYLVKVWYLLESQSLSRSPFVFADFTICTKIGVNSPWRTFQWSHPCDESMKSLDNAGPLNAFPFWQHYATSRTICSSPQIWVQKCLTSGKKQIQARSLLNDTHVWWAGICSVLINAPKTCDTFWVGIVWGETILLSVLTYANVHWQCICSEALLTSRARSPLAKAAAVICTRPSSLA